MYFAQLKAKEYDEFWNKHPQKTFLSTTEIGKLREKSGWEVYYVGMKEDKKVICAAMLVSKKRKFNKNEFYSPRGFLIDYNNKSLLESFTKEVKQFVKEKNGYILRIDPYVINKERDKDGNIVEGGIDNTNVVNTLKHLGFKEVPIKNREQVSWMFSLDIDGKTEEEILNNMKSNTRNIIRKTEKFGITINELSYDELDEFYKIMIETGKRREFKIRDISYYQEMYKLFSKKDQIKFYITRLNLKEYVERLTLELKEKEEKYNNTSDIKRNKGKKEEMKKDIELLTNRIKEANTIRKKEGKDTITLSGSMFILIYPEVVYLSSGNYEEYLMFNSQYLIQWELIKRGIKMGFKKHNFYGIPENINEHPKNYGIYAFKRGFDGYVEELIGEYELPITKHYYIFKLIHKLKELKNALHL